MLTPKSLIQISFFFVFPIISFAHPIHYHLKNSRQEIPALHSSLQNAVYNYQHSRNVHEHLHSRQAAEAGAAVFPEIEAVLKSNKEFSKSIEITAPGLLKKLADEGQSPQFAIYDCSDSRTSEGTVFNARPGTFFTQRNIANQFITGDPNSESVLAYGITELGVKHIVVMGHYGCGGVAAAIASSPRENIDAASNTVQTWIDPIRQLYLTSDREEIVSLRTANLALEANGTEIGEPEINEPGFRALVEENVKAQVAKIARSSIVLNAYQKFEEVEAAKGANSSSTETNNAIVTPSHNEKKRSEEEAEPIAIFIHGWVYDIETGLVNDLNITVSPPGVDAAALASAASAAEDAGLEVTTASVPASEATSSADAETSTSTDVTASESSGDVTTTVTEGSASASATETAVPAVEVALVEEAGNEAIVGIKTSMVPVSSQ